MPPYDNPYTWTDTLGDEHTLTTHCRNQETEAECQDRHDAAAAVMLDQWPEAE